MTNQSHRHNSSIAAVAQLVEQDFCKVQVGGSIPSSSPWLFLSFPQLRLSTMPQVKEYIGYMDKVDFEEELGRASDGNKVFPSAEAVRRHRRCSAECGIVKVRVVLEEVTQESNFNYGRKKTTD
jgi:hypothetical protein